MSALFSLPFPLHSTSIVIQIIKVLPALNKLEENLNNWTSEYVGSMFKLWSETSYLGIWYRFSVCIQLWLCARARTHTYMGTHCMLQPNWPSLGVQIGFILRVLTLIQLITGKNWTYAWLQSTNQIKSTNSSRSCLIKTYSVKTICTPEDGQLGRNV
jgi:hypothetical protein